MKHALSLLAAASLALACASAQAANSDTATATAVVLTPIAIAKTADMNFGNVVAGNGVVTLNTDGSRAAGGSTPLVVFGSSPTAAAFHVTGDGNQTFAISYPSLPTTLAGPSSSTMAFTICTAATAAASCSGTVTTGTLASGATDIYVGGTITVGASQTVGTYTGTVTVSVDYN
jgi:hypothetical protein